MICIAGGVVGCPGVVSCRGAVGLTSHKMIWIKQKERDGIITLAKYH